MSRTPLTSRVVWVVQCSSIPRCNSHSVIACEQAVAGSLVVVGGPRLPASRSRATVRALRLAAVHRSRGAGSGLFASRLVAGCVTSSRFTGHSRRRAGGARAEGVRVLSAGGAGRRQLTEQVVEVTVTFRQFASEIQSQIVQGEPRGGMTVLPPQVVGGRQPALSWRACFFTK